MRDEMPQKLPRYVFRRANGSYRYKRNVPKRLRHLIGKDTLYRQLGESYSEAMTALLKVHYEIEGLFEAEETMPANDRALALIRAALGEHVAEQVSSGQVVEYSHEDYALNELAETIAGKLPILLLIISLVSFIWLWFSGRDGPLSVVLALDHHFFVGSADIGEILKM